jgi:hypothetical protein
MNTSKLALLGMLFGFILNGCISSKTSPGRFEFKSGNFQNISYIKVTKKKGLKKTYLISINLNEYKNGKGDNSFINKETYHGKKFFVFHFIRDTAMLLKKNISLNLQRNGSDITKLSEEEYQAIKTALIKYPVLAIKYSLNVDSLKSYLGWYEVGH